MGILKKLYDMVTNADKKTQIIAAGALEAAKDEVKAESHSGNGIYMDGKYVEEIADFNEIASRFECVGTSAKEASVSMEKLSGAFSCCLEANQEKTDKETVNNWRKMHGIPMIRRRSIRKARRNVRS